MSSANNPPAGTRTRCCTQFHGGGGCTAHTVQTVPATFALPSRQTSAVPYLGAGFNLPHGGEATLRHRLEDGSLVHVVARAHLPVEHKGGTKEGIGVKSTTRGTGRGIPPALIYSFEVLGKERTDRGDKSTRLQHPCASRSGSHVLQM